MVRNLLLLAFLLCMTLLSSCGGSREKTSLSSGGAEFTLTDADIDAALDGELALAVSLTGTDAPAKPKAKGASAVVIPGGGGDTTDDCWVIGICNLTERFWNTDCTATGADVTYVAKVLFNDEDCIKEGYEVFFSRDGGATLGSAFTNAEGIATFTEPNVPIGVHTSTVVVTDYIPAGDVNGDGIPDPAPVAYSADLVFTVYNPCCCFCGKGTGKIDSGFDGCDIAQFHFKVCYNNGKLKGKFNFNDGDIRFQNEQITWAAAADNELHFGNGAVYIRVGNHGHPGKGVDFFEVYVWDTGNGEYHNSGLLTHGNVMRKSNKNKTGFGCGCKCDSHGGDNDDDGCDKAKKANCKPSCDDRDNCGSCGKKDCKQKNDCKPKCGKCHKHDCKDRDNCDNPKCGKCDKRDCKHKDKCDKYCGKCDRDDCDDKDNCDKPKCNQCGNRECGKKDKCKNCSKCDKPDCDDKDQCDQPKCKQCSDRDCKRKHECKDYCSKCDKKDCKHKDKCDKYCKKCDRDDCDDKDQCDNPKCKQCGDRDCKKKHKCKNCSKCDKSDCADKDNCDNPKCSKCDKRDCKDKHKCDKPKCKQCGDRECKSKDKCKDKCGQCGKSDCKSKDKCKNDKQPKCSKCGKSDCKSKDKCKDDSKRPCSKCGKSFCWSKDHCK
jgi:hypothetical protein